MPLNIYDDEYLTAVILCEDYYVAFVSVCDTLEKSEVISLYGFH